MCYNHLLDFLMAYFSKVHMENAIMVVPDKLEVLMAVY